MSSSVKCINASTLLLFMCLLCPFALSAQKKLDIGELRQTWYAPKGSVADSVRLKAGDLLTTVYISRNLDSLLTIAKEMIAYGQETNNQEWVSLSWIKMGSYHFMDGDLDAAETAYRKGIQIAQTHKAGYSLASGAMGLGVTLREKGQLDSAIYYTKKSLDHYKALPSQKTPLLIYSNLGIMYTEKGKYSEALRYLYKCQNTNHHSDASFKISNIFNAVGLEDKAKAVLAESMEGSKEVFTFYDWFAYYACAIALPSTLKEKEYWLNKGMALADSLQLRTSALFLLTSTASIYLDSLQLEKADRCIRRCQTLIGSTKQQLYAQNVVSSLQARLVHLRGNFRASHRLCQQILPFFEQHNELMTLSSLYDLQGKNAEQLGDPIGALAYIHKKEAVELKLNSKQEINAVLSDYFQQLSASEKKALQTAKANAESLASASQARERLGLGLFGAICLLLGSTSAFLFLFYRQKKKTVEVMARTNQSLALEQQKLRQSNLKLRQFSGVVSHDILSNLDLMLSAGNVLGGADAPKEHLLQYRNITQESSQQLKKYCLGLLEEARRTRQAADEVLHDPMPEVHAVLAQYGPALRAARFRVELAELSPALLPAPIAEQVFRNLVSNALRYAATAPEPRLRIAEERDRHGNTCWAVEDNGQGLRPERHRSIFDPQAAPQAGQAGQQMGLGLLRDTLREYGADLRAETAAGGGARFVVVFPSV